MYPKLLTLKGMHVFSLLAKYFSISVFLGISKLVRFFLKQVAQYWLRFEDSAKKFVILRSTSALSTPSGGNLLCDKIQWH